MTTHNLGFAPADVRYTLRLEGLAIFAATLVAYTATGGNWWLFAALILAPDLAFLAALAGQKAGLRAYNVAHTYTVPALLGAIAWFAAVPWLMSVALIWIAHIGLDRSLGYGLKYAGLDHATHLGWIGKAKARNGAPLVANAG
jgi:hypothetical protein